jgi:hypothetical protein
LGCGNAGWGLLHPAFFCSLQFPDHEPGGVSMHPAHSLRSFDPPTKKKAIRFVHSLDAIKHHLE